MHGGATPDMNALEGLPSHRGNMHCSLEPSVTHSHSLSPLRQRYNRDKPKIQVGYNVTFSTPASLSASVGSEANHAMYLKKMCHWGPQGGRWEMPQPLTVAGTYILY